MCGPNYAGLSCELAVSCQWWDPLRSFWSTEGCVTLPAAAAGVLNCACHHLTEFGGVAAEPIAALPKPPTKTFPTGADAQGDPLDAESTDHGYGNAPNHLVFLVIGAASAANLLLLCLGRYRQHRRKEHRKDYLIENPPKPPTPPRLYQVVGRGAPPLGGEVGASFAAGDPGHDDVRGVGAPSVARIGDAAGRRREPEERGRREEREEHVCRRRKLV